jgi:hypothetical protein
MRDTTIFHPLPNSSSDLKDLKLHPEKQYGEGYKRIQNREEMLFARCSCAIYVN